MTPRLLSSLYVDYKVNNGELNMIMGDVTQIPTFETAVTLEENTQ